MAASNRCTEAHGSLARSRNEYRLSLPDASCLKVLPSVLLRAAYLGVPLSSLPIKNGVVIVGALINCIVCNALLYELIVNTTPEKILQNSVAVLKLRRQEKHLWLIFFLGRGRRFPVRQRLSCKNFHGFYEVIFLDFLSDSRGQNSRRNLSTTNTICRWKSLSCRVLRYNTRCSCL